MKTLAIYLLLPLVVWAVVRLIAKLLNAIIKNKEKSSREAYGAFLNNWILKIEPEHRTEKRYPKDWLVRRQYVINGSDKKCNKCGRQLEARFIYSTDWKAALSAAGGRHYGWHIRHGHIHHAIPISKGGDHNLNNLVLLCEECHVRQDGHAQLRMSVNRDKYLSLTKRGYNIKGIRARRDYKCSKCRKPIAKRETYYGGSYWGKVCMGCHNSFMSDIGYDPEI